MPFLLRSSGFLVWQIMWLKHGHVGYYVMKLCILFRPSILTAFLGSFSGKWSGCYLLLSDGGEVHTPHPASFDTRTGELLVTAVWVWEFRLFTWCPLTPCVQVGLISAPCLDLTSTGGMRWRRGHLLIVWWGWRPRCFMAFEGGGSDCLKFPVFLGDPFPGPLAEKAGFGWA